MNNATKMLESYPYVWAKNIRQVEMIQRRAARNLVPWVLFYPPYRGHSDATTD